jgi:hypothetical protein
MREKARKGSMEEDHLGKPLLQKKEYPNCPGCKCAYLQHPDAKLPFKEYLNLFCLVLASCRLSLSLSLSPLLFTCKKRLLPVASLQSYFMGADDSYGNS